MENIYLSSLVVYLRVNLLKSSTHCTTLQVFTLDVAKFICYKNVHISIIKNDGVNLHLKKPLVTSRKKYNIFLLNLDIGILYSKQSRLDIFCCNQLSLLAFIIINHLFDCLLYHNQSSFVSCFFLHHVINHINIPLYIGSIKLQKLMHIMLLSFFQKLIPYLVEALAILWSTRTHLFNLKNNFNLLFHVFILFWNLPMTYYHSSHN
ncbi:hypothetical protein ACJX0J_010607 [Zea mays]